MSLMAEESIRALAAGLSELVRAPQYPGARGQCLYGAWLAESVLGNVGMALHHKLCHTLGGSFNLPHAQTHTAILPHAFAYNAAAVPAAVAAIRRALGIDHECAGAALFDLGRSLGATMSLAALGLRQTDLDHAAALTLADPYWNPRPIERVAVRALLQDAFEGRRPTA